MRNFRAIRGLLRALFSADRFAYLLSLAAFCLCCGPFLASAGKPSRISIEKISASANWSSRRRAYLPRKAIDGRTTEGETADFWLLPDRTTGWIQLNLRREYTITKLRILNTFNGPYRDRATLTCQIVFLNRAGEPREVYSGPLPLYPAWREFRFDGGKTAAAIRVNVLEYFRRGAGLNEIEVYGTIADAHLRLNKRIIAVLCSLVMAYAVLLMTCTGADVRRFLENPRFAVAFLGAAIGLILFVSVFGTRILNPTYIDWLMAGDPATHFLGWHFFRNEPWHLPPGKVAAYGAPDGTSVGYTDSIPLLALPLKFLGPVLPREFQYIGVWIMLCCVLQGVFGLLLMRIVTKSIWLCALGATFFVLSPTFLWRGGGHYSLMAHWTLLACLWLYLRQGPARQVAPWLAVTAITALIHPYLLTMVLLLWLAYLARRVIVDRAIGLTRALLLVVCVASISASCLWLGGYFMVRHSPKWGFTSYSANLNTLINPMGWSRILRDRPTAEPGQYEGFAYLGFGAMALCFWAAALLVGRAPSRRTLKSLLPLVLVCFAFLAFAVSNVVTFDEKVLFTYDPGAIGAGITQTFRGPGRYIWPVGYVLVLLALWAVASRVPRRASVAFLAALAILQAADLAGQHDRFNKRYTTQAVWHARLTSEYWRLLAGRYRNLLVIPQVHNLPGYERFAYVAAANGMTVNTGYFARRNWRKFKQEAAVLLENFKNHSFDPESLYVVGHNSFLRHISRDLAASDAILCMDGVYVLAPRWRDRQPAGAPGIGAELTLEGRPPSPFRVGTQQTVRVRVRNVSSAGFPAAGRQPVRLSYSWLTPLGKIAKRNGIRSALPADLKPGESVVLAATVAPPDRPGTYVLLFDLVTDDEHWFGERGSEVAVASVNVER